MCDCDDCEEKRVKRMKHRECECRKYKKCECRKCECRKYTENKKCIEKYNPKCCEQQDCYDDHQDNENKLCKYKENTNEKIIIISIN